MSLSVDLERRIAREVRAAVARDPRAALELARRTYADLREHKRQIKMHQRKVAVAKVTFAAFKCDLEAMGIEVIIESPIPTQPRQGGHSDRTERAA